MIRSNKKNFILLITCLCILFSLSVYAEDNIAIISEEPVIYYGPFLMNVAKSTTPSDGFVFHEEIPIDESLQHHLWTKCQECGLKYAFALAIMQRESEFNPKAGHSNRDGSYDRGIMQINSCWVKTFKKLGYITCGEDLYDPYTSINCAMYLLSEYVANYGNCEKVYAVYNTGNTKVNSNKNSRIVMQYWENWKSILGDI